MSTIKLKTSIIPAHQSLMSGRSSESSSEMTMTSIVKRRGRPKGAKNKPKLDIVQEEKIPIISSGRRGRPKGSKNKPKQAFLNTTDNLSSIEPAVSPVASTAKSAPTGTHPLIDLLNWVEKKTHHTQMQYYQRRASKLELSAKYLMASDILSLFSIQEPELLKTLKKKNV